MSLKALTAIAVKWNTLGAILTTGLQTLRLVVLARLLSPEDFGLMAMVMVVVGFAQAYADAGVSAALIHRRDVTSKTLSSLYWFSILAGILIFLLMWLTTPVALLLFGEPRLVSLLHGVAFTFLITPWGKQFEILLMKDLRFSVLAKVQISAAGLSTAVALITALLGQGVWALIWANLSMAFFQTMALAWIGYRKYRPLLHFSRQDLDGYLGFGFYQMGERSINFFAERMDQLVLGSLLGAQSLGYYNFAFNLVLLPITRLNPILTNVAFPVFAKVQEDLTRLQRGYLSLIRLVTTVNAPLLFGLAAVSPIAIPIVFGDQWLGSIPLVQILCLVALSRSVGNPVGSLLLAKGRADLGFRWNVFLFLVSGPTIVAGALLGDAIGVSWALLALQVALQLFTYGVLVRPVIGRCGTLYAKAILRPLSYSALMGGIVLFVGFIMPPGWGTLPIQIGIGIVFYFTLLWIADPAQMTELRDLVFTH